MGVICYQHGGDSISACSKEHRCTEQEIFLDGAKAGTFRDAVRAYKKYKEEKE